MNLTREEMFYRNLELAKKRLLYIVEHLGEAEAPPSGVKIIELPQNDPELLEANLKMALDLARQAARDGGEPILLLPEIDSRKT